MDLLTIVSSVISLISSIASLILAILAIWLSLYFYTKSKDNEANVKTYLEGIKTQVTSLEKLSGKWMDRLTRFVTTPQPMDAVSANLLDVIKELSSQGTKQTGMIDDTNNQPLLYREEKGAEFATVKQNSKRAKK